MLPRFITSSGVPVNWDTAVVGGLATVDIFKVIDNPGTKNDSRRRWATTGEAVAAWRVRSAKEQSQEPIEQPTPATTKELEGLLTREDADALYVQGPGPGVKLVLNPPASYVPAAGEVVLTGEADGIPKGGALGQILVKTAAGDYAVGWAEPGLTAAAIKDLIATQLLDKKEPAFPGSLAAAPGNASAVATWTAPADTDIFRYEVRVGPTDPPTSTPVPAARGVLTATVTGLTNNTQHYAQVRAADYSGNYSTWSPSVPVTPVEVLQAADFTAADGSALGSPFITYVSSGGIVDVQSNRLRMKMPSGAWSAPGTVFLGFGRADLDITFDAAFTTPTSTPSNTLYLVLRHGESQNGAAYQPYYGYRFNVTEGSMSFTRRDNGSDTVLTSGLTFPTLAAGVARRFRLWVKGGDYKLKSWDPTGAEPTAWDWTGSDGTTGSRGTPRPYFYAQSGSGSREFFVDNLRVIAP